MNRNIKWVITALAFGIAGVYDFVIYSTQHTVTKMTLQPTVVWDNPINQTLSLIVMWVTIIGAYIALLMILRNINRTSYGVDK